MILFQFKCSLYARLRKLQLNLFNKSHKRAFCTSRTAADIFLNNLPLLTFCLELPRKEAVCRSLEKRICVEHRSNFRRSDNERIVGHKEEIECVVCGTSAKVEQNVISI